MGTNYIIKGYIIITIKYYESVVVNDITLIKQKNVLVLFLCKQSLMRYSWTEPKKNGMCVGMQVMSGWQVVGDSHCRRAISFVRALYYYQCHIIIVNKTN